MKTNAVENKNKTVIGIKKSASYPLLEKQLAERILILDGAMGTMIQAYKFEEQDYRGDRFADWHSDVKGNNLSLIHI